MSIFCGIRSRRRIRSAKIPRKNAARFTTGEQVFLFGTSEILRKMDIPNPSTVFRQQARESRLAVFPIPGKLGSRPFFGGSYLAIPASAKHAKSAQRLLLFLLRADNLNRYTHGIGFLPPDESVLNVWAKDSRYSGLVKDLEHGQSFPEHSGMGRREKELIAMTNDIGAHYRHAEKVRKIPMTRSPLFSSDMTDAKRRAEIQNTTDRSAADGADTRGRAAVHPHKAIKGTVVGVSGIFQWILGWASSNAHPHHHSKQDGAQPENQRKKRRFR